MSTIAPKKGKVISGDHWVICDRTGQKARRSDCRYEWNGLLVRADVWEQKQPQLDIRAHDDKIAVQDARPRQPDRFRTDVTPDEL